MRIDSATHSNEGRIFTLFLRITNQEAVSNTMGGFEQQEVPLPEIAYERLWAVGTKNPDFPIKNWIFRRATCSSYFRDILVWCECTYAQTCPCRILAEMKGVIHSHSDARKCAKKNQTRSQNNHIPVHFERWNSTHIIPGMQYTHISGF